MRCRPTWWRRRERRSRHSKEPGREAGFAPWRDVRVLTMIVLIGEALMALGLWAIFDPTRTGWRAHVDMPWIPEWGAGVTLGVDGISLVMVLLTTLLMPLAVFASWSNVEHKIRSYYGLLLILVITMIATGTLNTMIERVAYRPLRNAPKLAPLITAVGFSFILQNIGLLWLGGSHRGVPDLINTQEDYVTIFGVPITHGDLLALVVTVPLFFFLINFISRSRIGRAMRATAQDPQAARLMGINVDTTIAFTFILGGLMAGAAAMIYALYQTTLWYFAGFQAGLIAFTAAVMGGIGNLQGAVLGGLIIGVIQTISDDRIEAIVSQLVKDVPSSFNSQSSRLVLLLKDEHDKFWDIVRDALKAIVPEDKWESTANRIGGFRAGYGTVSFVVYTLTYVRSQQID